jgi:hypothetical protein
VRKSFMFQLSLLFLDQQSRNPHQSWPSAPSKGLETRREKTSYLFFVLRFWEAAWGCFIGRAQMCVAARWSAKWRRKRPFLEQGKDGWAITLGTTLEQSIAIGPEATEKGGGHVRLGKNTNNEAVTHIHSTT